LHTQSLNKYAPRFLLVSLSIEGILHESTISRRREKLSKITNGLELEDIYYSTIERIKAQDGDKSRLGMTALMWVSHAERQLQANELCHALAIQIGSTDFDDSNIPSISTLVNCCQGLITMDKEVLIVRLIHFTLQEYLSAHFHIFIKPHSAMAEICLTYLNSQQVKALSTALSSDAQNTPFLQYCSVYWGVHAKKELSDNGKSLALEVLKGDYSRISTELLLEHANRYYKGCGTCVPLRGLHCASFFGIVEVVFSLIQARSSDINEEGYLGCTPLSWAAYNGHEEVVKMLLARGEVVPDKANKLGRTPLLDAARNGHEEVVKLFLGREEVNPNTLDEGGETSLFNAVVSGHEGVVKILLGREEVNPNKAGRFGKTPLTHAAWKGYEEIVKILLGREGVNPDAPDNCGDTPLFNAVLGGNEGMVKILLEREDVNPSKPNKWGETPLSIAVYCRLDRIVTLLTPIVVTPGTI